jgi:hypothetical protein
MTIKVLETARKLVIFLLPLLFVVACENDLDTVDAGFIDNKNFETLEDTFEVGFSTEVIDRVETGNFGRYLLGVYKDANLGTLKASFVSQLSLPTSVLIYDTQILSDTLVTSTMDSVVLYIPYESSLRESDTDTKGTYVLDSVFGKFDVDTEVYGGFDIEVYELETFLNSLDPTDAGKANTFYTDATYSEGEKIGSVTNFVPSHLDTVTFIERMLDGESYYKDSISLETAKPRMAIPLSKSFFETKILSKLSKSGADKSTELSSANEFIRYFKGLYVKAVSNDAASMASLRLTDAYVEMYYTNLLENASDGVDIDTIRETKKFLLSGILAGVHEHDGARGDDTDNIYIQGATGSEGNIALFDYDEAFPDQVSSKLTDLRTTVNENGGAIINEASIKLYVDGSSIDAVNRLFIYKNTTNGNFQLKDYITASTTSGAQGYLQQEDNEGRYYYEFRITDYITGLLEDGNESNVDNLRVKVFMEGDLPTAVSDTIISSNSWDPRGVVLSGTEIELKVNYSRIK